MPVERAVQSRRLYRSSPLPKAHYTIPKRLPSPFGVNELFDWSSSRAPAHSGSSRSTSNLTLLYQRTSSFAETLPMPQEHSKPAVQNWVNNQKEHLTLSRKPELPTVPDVVSISSSSTRPLFTPSSSPPCSPVPIIRETSTLLQPLPTPVTSPTHATRKLPSATAPLAFVLSEKIVSSVHHEKPRSGSPLPLSLRKSNNTRRNDLDVNKKDWSQRQAELTEADGRAGDKGKGKAEMGGQGDKDEQYQGDSEDEGESVYESMVGSKAYGENERNSGQLSVTEQEVEETVQNESESESESESEQETKTSEDETEFAREVKPRAPIYLDLAAKVESFKTKAPSAHQPKSDQSLKKSEGTEEAGWTGALQGTLLIRKRGNGGEVAPPGKWSFSGDGAARQPVKDRAVGDIHFSPSFAGSECDYWVLHGSPKYRWIACKEGHPHPLVEGYVLGGRKGAKAPRWIKAQSLRADKCRVRKSI
ncbi:hypothetical protein FRC12_015872 [Ceratobasidium sp. 428]|nr:hypothetical protein FRC12_015872 [Ceratobasidium sp. 428]